jgi:hypothetical protein
MHGLNINGQMSDGLHRIGMEKDGMLPGDSPDSASG